ncbi:MAG: hypothetical protein U5K28_12790 [Halobacteriales archaeon]|nr:hypothetical protein [Halobacteriales archaeon]
MSQSDSPTGKSIVPSDEPHISSQTVGGRPAFFLLGRAGGCDLVAAVRTETIYVVDRDAGCVVHHYTFAGRTLDAFMAAYEEAYGWDERLYGGLSGMVSRAMDV